MERRERRTTHLLDKINPQYENKGADNTHGQKTNDARAGDEDAERRKREQEPGDARGPAHLVEQDRIDVAEVVRYGTEQTREDVADAVRDKFSVRVHVVFAD